MENKKQHKSNSCKNYFCPICLWKETGKDAWSASVMIHYLKEEKQFVVNGQLFDEFGFDYND